jgi:uncharacterized protein (DUF1697 family)
MVTYIALLRAVNVGGHGKIAMTDIRDCLTQAKFAEVRTVLQSGNVVLGSNHKSTAAVEAAIEKALRDRFSLSTDAMARTVAEWKRLIAGNPFLDAAFHDPSHLVALVTKHSADAKAADALRAIATKIGGKEQIGFQGGQLYATYPDGIGNSKLTSGVIERVIQCPVTARNWNTVLKLAAMCGQTNLK